MSQNFEITEEERLQMIELRNWLKQKDNLIVKDYDDLKILYFVRSAKLNIDRAKKKIETFSQVRIQRQEWFSNRDPFVPELQELFKLGIFLPLEKRAEEPFIVIIRTSIHDPWKHTFDNVLKCSKMILDLLMTLEPSISKTGIAAILDMKGVQMSHALQLTPKLIKKLVASMESYPLKVKLLEFINCPVHVNVVLNTFRLFMSPKMKSRLVSRLTTSEVEAELPCDIGGNGKSYQEIAENWKQIVENNANFYKENI